MLKKRIVSSVLAVFTVVLLLTPAAAASTRTASEAANALYAVGLFQGTAESADGTPVFSLGDKATRAEAVTMLVRLLGRESEALKGAWKTPFADVPGWAAPYIGYAYENGLTNGLDSTTFGSELSVTANDYLTLLLRALGYDDAAGDFSWSVSSSFAASLGLGAYAGSADFTRGDVAKASCIALYITPKNESGTLLAQLDARGVVGADDIKTAGLSDALTPGNAPAGVAGTPPEAATAAAALTAAEVYAQCSPAVFYIEVYDSRHELVGTASGFFISADGKAVTNYHVIEDASYATITLADGKTTYDVTGVYDYNTLQDVALLQIDGKDFPYLTPAADAVVGGQTVYAIGSPLGLSNTISQGIISNVSRTLQGTNYIQISAAISSGSSGGALLDEHGAVLGVTAAGLEYGQNLNFAVPYSGVQTLSSSHLRTLTDVIREVNGLSGTFGVSPANVSLKVGDSVSVTLTQSFSTASTVGYNVTNRKTARMSWGAWSTDGKSLPVKITGESVGTSTVMFYLYGKNGTMLAETSVKVTVTE